MKLQDIHLTRERSLCEMLSASFLLSAAQAKVDRHIQSGQICSNAPRLETGEEEAWRLGRATEKTMGGHRGCARAWADVIAVKNCPGETKRLCSGQYRSTFASDESAEVRRCGG